MRPVTRKYVHSGLGSLKTLCRRRRAVSDSSVSALLRDLDAWRVAPDPVSESRAIPSPSSMSLEAEASINAGKLEVAYGPAPAESRWSST